MNKFLYGMNEKVKVRDTGREATIVGRAEFAHSVNQYYLNYLINTRSDIMEEWCTERLVTNK